MRVILPEDSKRYGLCHIVQNAILTIQKIFQEAIENSARDHIQWQVVYRDAPETCKPFIDAFIAKRFPLKEYQEGMVDLGHAIWYISPYGGGHPPRNFCGKIYDTTCPVIKLELKTIENWRSQVNDWPVIFFCETDSAERKLMESKQSVLLIDSNLTAESVRLTDEALVIQQSTFKRLDSEHWLEIIKKNNPSVTFSDKRNTCHEIQERKAIAKRIAFETGVVIIVGDRHSHHGQWIVESIKQTGNDAYLIQSPDELESSMFQMSIDNQVGVLSTSATPKEKVLMVVTAIEQWGM